MGRRKPNPATKTIVVSEESLAEVNALKIILNERHPYFFGCDDQPLATAEDVISLACEMLWRYYGIYGGEPTEKSTIARLRKAEDRLIEKIKRNEK